MLSIRAIRKDFSDTDLASYEGRIEDAEEYADLDLDMINRMRDIMRSINAVLSERDEEALQDLDPRVVDDFFDDLKNYYFYTTDADEAHTDLCHEIDNLLKIAPNLITFSRILFFLNRSIGQQDSEFYVGDDLVWARMLLHARPDVAAEIKREHKMVETFEWSDRPER